MSNGIVLAINFHGDSHLATEAHVLERESWRYNDLRDIMRERNPIKPGEPGYDDAPWCWEVSSHAMGCARVIEPGKREPSER